MVLIKQLKTSERLERLKEESLALGVLTAVPSDVGTARGQGSFGVQD